MVRRYFSVDEAERRLTTLSPLVRQAQELKHRIDAYNARVRRQLMTDGSEEDLLDITLDAEYEELKQHFYHTVERIEEHGCLLRDIDSGVVDFYTRFEGRDVFLSWRVGERRISHWHELDESVDDGKRIVELR